MSAAPIHPLTLRFASAYTEAAFRVDFARRSVGLARAALFIGLAQFALFGFLDRLMVPEAFEEVQMLRLVACVVVAGCIAYTFAPAFLRTTQAALAVAPLAVGSAIVAMSIVGQQASGYYDYYAGLLLVLFYVHVLLRLRFAVASAVGLVLIAAYLAAAVALETPTPYLLNNTFFLASANLTGMVASYALERYARQVFHHARQQARTHAELAAVLDGLRTAQARLIQQEKMAGLGRFTAGVAHELKNPLNFVVNFSAMNAELAADLRDALAAGDTALAEEILTDVEQNAAKVREHGERADAIVRGMLAHAGPTRGTVRAVDLNALVGGQAALARDAFRHRHAGFDAAFCFDPDPALGPVVVVPQEIGRVVTALVDNALYATLERMQGAAGGDGAPFTPAVTVRTRATAAGARIEVADNGTGIPLALRDRVFEPFFTTKPTGSGTGLDLSLAYEVVTRGHGGALTFETAEGRGTTFAVTLPAALRDAAPDTSEEAPVEAAEAVS